MKRIILFRFHQEFGVCKNRLELVRAFNPDIDVYGLYGGPSKYFATARKLPLKHVWEVPLDDPYWKWVNGDLCIRWWFKAVGESFDFAMLHVFEWDMLLLESVEKQFGHVKSGVALTGLKPLSEVMDTSVWVGPRRGRKEWDRLLAQVQRLFNYDAEPLVGLYGGACLSRKFLERFARVEVRSWCNDEVRTALFAQAFKMRVVDTQMFNSHFNSNYTEPVPVDAVYQQYEKGIKAFHPVRELVNTARIRKIRQALSRHRLAKLPADTPVGGS